MSDDAIASPPVASPASPPPPRSSPGADAAEEISLDLPHTATSPSDLAGRIRDLESAVDILVRALKAERCARRHTSDTVDELAEAAHRHKKRVKRAEVDIEELRNRLGQVDAAVQAAPAGTARGEGSAGGGGQRRSTGGRKSHTNFNSCPDPDRPVTDEDKQRIRSNINRLPPERMLPLVSFVQSQLPRIAQALPGLVAASPQSIEVDFDTLDNRTLRMVDHKVRQALALAGQARRRAERRLLEQQLAQEMQQRHPGVINP